MDLQHKIDKHAALVADCRDVFKQSPQGRRLLEHLKQRFHFYSSTASIDLLGQPVAQVDRDTQLLNEGQRSVICYIEGLMETDTSALQEMAERQARQLKQQEQEIDDLGV